MTSADLAGSFKKHPIGFACGAIALGCAGWLYYRSGESTVRQANYEQKAAEAEKMIANVRNAEKLPQHVAEIQALSKELDARLIRPAQLAVNLQYFYRLEAETEVKLIDVRQASMPKSTGKTQYVGVPYSVTVQGSFKQVMAFLQKLETGPHFPRFLNVSFAKLSQGSEGPSAAAITDVMNVVINLELLGVP